MAKKSQKKGKDTGRDAKGRFLKGHGTGRPKGSCGKHVLSCRTIVADRSEQLIKKALDLAIVEGNERMLSLFVGKLLPAKGMDAGIAPQGKTALEMIESLLSQLRTPGVTGADASGHIELIKTLITAKELDDFEKRLKVLEEKDGR